MHRKPPGHGPRALPLFLLLASCNASSWELGGFTVDLDHTAGTLSITHLTHGDVLEQVHLAAGSGSAEVDMAFGSFLFSEEQADMVQTARFQDPREVGNALLVTALTPERERLGDLYLEAYDDDTLSLRWSAASSSDNRVALSADCTPDDHFLGLGAHAMDVDHVGQAFPLWVSEPGIGKVDDETPPQDWSLTGTRHASSYPVPFLLRPEQAHGLVANTSARVEVDLCASDPERFELRTWQGASEFVLLSQPGPLEVVQALNGWTGRVSTLPDWALAPWNDAVGGPDRVRAVATTLRAAGAPSSVIWSEDWKGAEQTATGFRLKGEWFLDEERYPDAHALADELKDQGFRWLAYFSPFIVEGTLTWDAAQEAGLLISDDEGLPYTFPGVTLASTSLLDLTHADAADWAAAWMTDALDLGFDGWMADYGEWLPTDASLTDESDGLETHNAYPVLWQAANRLATEDRDAVFFSRAGWLGSSGLAPLVWGGDQRTSFDEDDGLPSVLAMGLGLAASGVAMFTHDVAGYQSIGNDPSDQELWYRWAALGAFSPVMRTHHGAFDDENWQFDEDDETLAFWAGLCREQVRLFPYRQGLAMQAAEDGTPMVLPPAFLFEGEEWGRKDAWMLGPNLLVAPVMERGASGREVALPAGVTWYDWWTLEPAVSGWKEARWEEIPVFAPAGATIPTLAQIPDTLTEDADNTWLSLAEVDDSRVVYLFAGGSTFEEGDGTRYTSAGAPLGAGDVEVTLTTGTTVVAGVTVEINGPRERTYRLVVVP